MQAYLASIAFVDAQLGKVLDALEARGPDGEYRHPLNFGNTVVVVWSDHGWHLGEKEHWRKHTLWEEATRVPLLVAGPGVETPGRTVTEAVSLLDLFPTLIDLAGIPVPADTGLPGVPALQGRSLRPLLTGEAGAWAPVALTELGRSFAIRDDHLRYIRYRDASEELYDHRVDPHEFTNLADDVDYAPELVRLRGLARELVLGDPTADGEHADPGDAGSHDE